MSDSFISRILDREFRWPTSGDQLFVSGRDALLAKHPSERLYHMPKGYKLAADILVEHAIQADGRSGFQKLGYPIVFCYRHYIELALKGVVELYGPSHGVTPDRSSHKLEDLWELFENLLDRIGGIDLRGAEVLTVATCVAEFAKIDPQSVTFRYPVAKNGQSIELKDELLDLAQLRDVMDGIDNFFEVIDAHLQSLEYVDSMPAL